MGYGFWGSVQAELDSRDWIKFADDHTRGIWKGQISQIELGAPRMRLSLH